MNTRRPNSVSCKRVNRREQTFWLVKWTLLLHLLLILDKFARARVDCRKEEEANEDKESKLSVLREVQAAKGKTAGPAYTVYEQDH